MQQNTLYECYSRWATAGDLKKKKICLYYKLLCDPMRHNLLVIVTHLQTSGKAERHLTFLRHCQHVYLSASVDL